MSALDTYVTVTGSEFYPAWIANPENRWNGFVFPLFTLTTVRQLAANTQADAARYGHDCIDTVHVIDGDGTEDGRARAVVLLVEWQHYDHEGPRRITTIIEPTEDGLYGIGGGHWTWEIVPDGPLAAAQVAAAEARQAVYAHAARAAGDVLRRLMPEATGAVVDLTDDLAHIIAVHGVGTVAWPTGTDADGDDGYGPFDTETLGEADEVLRSALDFGRDADDLRAAGWQRDKHHANEYRITFPYAAK